MLRAVGIAFKRLVATKVEFLRRRLAERPLAGAEGRRSMIEQTRDIEDFLFCISHFTYPIQQNFAAHKNDSAPQRNYQAECNGFAIVGPSTVTLVAGSIRQFN